MESNAAIFRIFIFILLGSHVDFGLLRQHLGAGLGVIAVFLFVARPLTVLACALPDRRGAWQWRELLFLFWVRETGVIPAAIAGVLLAMKVPHADVIASITFLAVVVTIVVQAGTTGMLAHRLGVLEEPPSAPLPADPRTPKARGSTGRGRRPPRRLLSALPIVTSSNFLILQLLFPFAGASAVP